MNKNVEYLNPKTKLLEAVASWLLADERVRKTPEGARSLAHLLVVVPTAQSGRNLRLTLAKMATEKGWGGLLPPTVALPMQLVKPASKEYREATATEAAAAFQQYVKSHSNDVKKLTRLIIEEDFEDLTARFALFDQLQDIWRALAGRGFLMCDVLDCKEIFGDDMYDDRSRWEELARLEKGYFDFLHASGLIYPTEAVSIAKTNAEILPDEIEEIVLPALADPLRVLSDVITQQATAGKRINVLIHADKSISDAFDELGWPKTEAWTGNNQPAFENLENCDIICSSATSDLAHVAASDFPSPENNSELPSVGLCDESLYEEVASSFLNRGYLLHNPEQHKLTQSSLGLIVRNLMALYSGGELPWKEFISLLRCHDVVRALSLKYPERTALLNGIDIAQNYYIPSTIPADFVFPEHSDIKNWQKSDFDTFCKLGKKLADKLNELKKDASMCTFLRNALKWIFENHFLHGTPEEEEFVAATQGLRDFLDSLEGDYIKSLQMTENEFVSLAERELDAALFSLKSDSTDAIKTEGWLELAWTPAERISLLGLHEGVVPDSIAGHPFLPDSLRKKLGLVTNDDRMARDTWILKELLDARESHSVRVYIARTNSNGDMIRPSRLLYLCRNEELTTRVKYLIGDLPEVEKNNARKVEWPLALPDEVAVPEKFSPSQIDTYIKCPFTYLLKYGVGMKASYHDKDELEDNDFGTLIHAILKEYADRQIKLGEAQLTDAGEIENLLLNEIMPKIEERYRNSLLNIKIQLDVAKERLSLFAKKQAELVQAGWRIKEAEYEVDVEVTLGDAKARIRGIIDRIDKNIDTGKYRLIDYKTWNEKSLSRQIYSSAIKKGSSHEKFAGDFYYKIIDNIARRRRRILSAQLPLYGKALEAQDSIQFADMEFRYFVLGKNEEETALLTLDNKVVDTANDNKVVNTDDNEVVNTAIDTAEKAIKLIQHNIFWPPSPTEEWKRDFGGFFVASPEVDLAKSEWADKQISKLKNFKKEGK